MSTLDTLRDAQAVLTPPILVCEDDRELIGLIERLARELAWARLHLQAIHHEAQKALTHRANKGGQQAGIPAWSQAPVSTLSQLVRETEVGLDPAKIHGTTAELLKAALEETT